MKILTPQRNSIHYLITYISQSQHSPETGGFVIQVSKNAHFYYILLKIFLQYLNTLKHLNNLVFNISI